MKTLITALVVTAMLATSAVAKTQRTQRTDATRIHPNNAVVHLNHSRQEGAPWYCRFHLPQTDPDPQVRLNMLRDCKHYETED